MRSLIIIWILVLVTIIGGGVYMSNAINELIERVPETHTSAVTSFNSLEVRNSTSSDKQLITYAEDNTTEVQLLQDTDYLQVTRHWAFLQDTQTANAIQGSFNQ